MAKAVAYLRSAIGAAVDDPGLTELVGELILRSERFPTLWARQVLVTCHAEPGSPHRRNCSSWLT
jgi:hypothetical protein